MSQLSRAIQKIFGIDGATSEFGQIGSKAAGSPATTKNLTTIQSLSQYDDGLPAILSDQSTYWLPYLEDLNALFFLVTSQLTYLFQNGIPEWLDSASQRYYADVSFVIGSDGALYQAILGDDASNINAQKDPTTETSWWKKILDADMIDDIESAVTDVAAAQAQLDASVLVTTGTPQAVGEEDDVTFNSIETDGVALKTKVLEIGDWNMDTITGATVAHGLGANWKKVRALSAIIRNDDDSSYSEISGCTYTGLLGGEIVINSTNIILSRDSGGRYDGADYDSTSYNRGWITITYEA
jgi:hypothetical protein